MIPLNRKCFLTNMMCGYLGDVLDIALTDFIMDADISTKEGLEYRLQLKKLREHLSYSLNDTNNPVGLLRDLLELKESNGFTLGLEDFRLGELGYEDSIRQDIWSYAIYIHNLKDCFNNPSGFDAKWKRMMVQLDHALKEVYSCRNGNYEGNSDGLEDPEYSVFQMLYALELATLLLITLDRS